MGVEQADDQNEPKVEGEVCDADVAADSITLPNITDDDDSVIF